MGIIHLVFVALATAVGSVVFLTQETNDWAWGMASGTATLVLLEVLLIVVLPWLADTNVLVTRVREGTAKAILRGQSFERTVVSVAGSRNGERSLLLRQLGLYWVGWPWMNEVYTYTFRWNELRPLKDGTQEVWAREGLTDFVFVVPFPYVVIADRLETEDLLQVKVTLVITVVVVYPYLALFGTEDWMRRVTAAVVREARNVTGKTTYTDLKSEIGPGSRSYASLIMALNDKLPDDPSPDPAASKKERSGLVGRYGIRITAVDCQDVELTGTAAQRSQDAAAEVFVAEQKGQAKRIAADAQAYATTTVATAEAKALKDRAAAAAEHGETGQALIAADALAKAGEQGNATVWGVDALTGLASMFGQKGKS